MLVGPQLPPENVSLLRLAVERSSAEGEETIAVLGMVRARSQVSALAVTTHRLLTLGRVAKGSPVLEEFFHGDNFRVHVERESLLARGRVRVRIGEHTHLLGVLTPTGDERAFDILERAMERATQETDHRARLAKDAGRPELPDPVMPTIPVPGATGMTSPRERPEDDLPRVGVTATGASQGATDDTDRHPLVAQLAELAGLHRDGALTEEEFSAAKARLLGDA